MQDLLSNRQALLHPVTMQFLELSEISFSNKYGPKLKEGWLFNWSELGYLSWIRRRLSMILWFFFGTMITYLLLAKILEGVLEVHIHSPVVALKNLDKDPKNFFLWILISIISLFVNYIIHLLIYHAHFLSLCLKSTSGVITEERSRWFILTPHALIFFADHAEITQESSPMQTILFEPGMQLSLIKPTGLLAYLDLWLPSSLNPGLDYFRIQTSVSDFTLRPLFDSSCILAPISTLGPEHVSLDGFPP